jgi:ABC-type oligopeptide transport system substrate-binding subunit
MITLGAYQLTSYDQDSLIRLDRNPYYWRGLPPTETILARVVREDVTALRLYEAGKLDILTDLPVLEISRLKKNPEFKVFPYLKTVYLGFQQRKYPTQNVKVRQAIQASLDLRELPKILGGSQVQAGSFLPPEIGGEGKSVWLESRRERARALWKEAALDPLKETKLEILIPNFEKTTMVAQWIQAKLRESLQIEVDIQAFDHKTFRTQLAMGASPLFLLSWSADYPDPENFLSVFSSSSGNNRTGFKSEHYDQLLEAALRELKPERRKQMYRTLDRILTQEQVVIVPLYHEPNLALVKRNLKGVDFSPLNELSLRKVSR